MPIVYLIPSMLHEEGLGAISTEVTDAVSGCQVFFVENERTARRYLKRLLPQIVIDNYEWFVINDRTDQFRQKLKENKNIGIISEAGCPGIADPGQSLVAVAQEMNITVKPLAGPSSILLALMASGMNGQQFRFNGYLPIPEHERGKAIRDLESESKKKNCTEIFIETPYRNNALLNAMLKHCQGNTRLCIAVDLTGKNEFVRTKTIAQWKKDPPDLHKKQAIFLIYAAG